MFIQSHEGRKILEQVSRELVARTAPEELEIFDELAGEYFADPSPPNLSRQPKDSPTGFGPDELLAAVTPAAMAMTSVCMTFLLGGDVLRSAREWTTAALKRKLAEPLKPGPGALSAEQRDKVAELAYEASIRYGMDPERAGDMVNALFVALVREPELESL